MNYDFGGYATRNDLRCSDGRTIKRDAFKDNDGQSVPLVWQHQHNDPMNVLGYCKLENRDDGVYAYGSFNDTQSGLNAKKLVAHGDVTSLSIYANHLVEKGGSVLHGAIKEVSLVLSGANPGAVIDDIAFAHSDDGLDMVADEAIIYSGNYIEIGSELEHADADEEKEDDQNETEKSEETIKDVYETLNAEQKETVNFLIAAATGEIPDDEVPEIGNGKKSLKDIFDSMSDKQKNVAYYLVGIAEQSKKNNKKEEKDMAHSDYEEYEENIEYDDYLEHADEETVGDIIEGMDDDAENYVIELIEAASKGKKPNMSGDKWDSLSEKEKDVAKYLISLALDEASKENSKEDSKEIKHADEDDEEEPKRSPEEIVASLSSDKKRALEQAMEGKITQAKFAVEWGKFNQEERDAVMALIKKDKNIKHDDLEGGNTTMNYNVFELNDEVREGATLSHADTEAIFTDAKRFGSLKESFLAHTAGAVTDPNGGVAGTDYGIGNAGYLFPDSQLVDKNVELIRNNPTDWVAKIMNGVKKSPFARIKTMYAEQVLADGTNKSRAKGYTKGNLKTPEVIRLLKRETSPTTIYKMQKLDRDDIADITDFNVVAWLKAEMKVMLEEEVAHAILLGDGRTFGTDPDAIDPEKIRPIVSDHANDVYAVKYSYTGDEEDFIDACNISKIEYQGTGMPSLFVAPATLAHLLIMKDGDGRRLWRGRDDLCTALGVKEIIEVPYMATQALSFTDGDSNACAVTGIMVNLADYTVGSDKAGAVTMFDDFDIDFNQQKYLIETRISGALSKYHSAIIIGKHN